MNATTMFAAAALACAMSGCNTKMQQCNNFVETVNEHSTKLGSSISGASPDDAEKVEAWSKEISGLVDAAVAAIEAVQIKDDQLTGFAGEYKTYLGDVKTFASDLHAATKENDAKKLEEVVKRSEGLEKSESDLVDNINVYCTGSK